MKHWLSGVGSLLVLAGALWTVSSTTMPVRAQSDGQDARFLHRRICSDGTLRGSYAARTEGSVVNAGPFAAVGIFTFESSGVVTNTATSSTNGVIQTGSVVGTYRLNDDCTGDMTIPSVNPNAPPLSFNLVVAGRGQEIYYIATRSPAVLTGVARRTD